MYRIGNIHCNSQKAENFPGCCQIVNNTADKEDAFLLFAADRDKTRHVATLDDVLYLCAGLTDGLHDTD